MLGALIHAEGVQGLAFCHPCQRRVSATSTTPSPSSERYAGHIRYFVEPVYRGHANASRALRLQMGTAR